MSQLTDEQKKVIQSLYAWVASPTGQYVTVGGYAGTGKTTLIAVLSKLLHRDKPKITLSFGSFTGKATQNLKSKLESSKALIGKDTISTLHGLMYSPKVDSKGQVVSWRKNKSIKSDLIIVDEASMITADLWQDLQSYKLPIIAFGDHGQLPPVGEGFSLMDKPDMTLTQIHRQAETSPILKIATLARTTGEIPSKLYSDKVIKSPPGSETANGLLERFFSSPNHDTLVLCNRNKTRVGLNNYIRTLLGKDESEPMIGDRLICLKNNYEASGGPIYNGLIGQLTHIRPEGEHWYQAEIDFSELNQTYSGLISRHQFNNENSLLAVKGLAYKAIGDRFDFGYALTVHKAQGSEAERVILYEERNRHMSDDDWRRWLYTAVTRAKSELYIVGN